MNIIQIAGPWAPSDIRNIHDFPYLSSLFAKMWQSCDLHDQSSNPLQLIIWKSRATVLFQV